MSHPSRTKTQGGDRFSRNRPFSAQGRNLWAGWSDSPAQKLLARSWTGPEIFIKILSFHQKLFNFLIRTDTQTDRQTDRQTDTQTHEPPSIYGRAKFFYACFWYLFTSLRSLRSLRSWRIICNEINALAFNRDTCCHLVFCLQLLPFHYLSQME